MKKTIEKHSFKIQIGTLIAILMFSVSSSWSLFSLKGDMEKRIYTLEMDQAHIKENYKELSTDYKDELQAVKTELRNVSDTLLILGQRIEFDNKSNEG